MAQHDYSKITFPMPKDGDKTCHIPLKDALMQIAPKLFLKFPKKGQWRNKNNRYCKKEVKS